MNKSKIFLSLMLVFLMIFSLAACKGENTSPEQNETKDKTGTAESKTSETADIVFWEMMWGPADSYTETVEGLVEQFNNSQTEVNVKVQLTPWDNFYQTFLTAVSSGAAPDVSTGAFPQDIQYAKMGEILYLDPIIEQWEEENNPILDDFMQSSIDLHKYEGKQAGLPWCADPSQIVYRKDIFEQAGITDMPETWDEFLDVCRAIKEKTDVVPFVFAAADNRSTLTMLNFMFTNNVGITDENVNPTFDDPKVVETLQFFSTLYEEKLIPEGTVSYKGADADKVFYSGKAAMLFSGAPNDIYSYEDINDKSGIMPPFAGRSGEKRAIAAINPIMAYNQTKSPEGSMAFIKWWMENNLPLWSEGKAGPFPARLSYLSNPYFTEDWVKNEISEKVIKVGAPLVWPSPNLYPEFAQFEGEDYPGLALQRVLSGDTDFEAIVKDVNEKILKAFGK